MKPYIPFSLLLVFILVSSCSSTKLVQTPFSDKQYQTNAQYIRATGVGKHVQKQVAQTIAMNKSREALAGQIRSVVEQRITEINQREGERLEKSSFERTSKVIVNEALDQYKVVDQKTIKQDDGTTEVWIVLEMPRAVIEKKLQSASIQ